MKFSEFSKYLLKLEKTTKRLEITAILSELIQNLSKNEIDKGIYLSLGYLKAPFESEKFNIADKMMVRALSEAYSTDVDKVQSIYTKLGDLGDVAYELDPNTTHSDLEIIDVHKELLEIAQLEGTGSQEAKITKLSKLLQKLHQLSAKYVTRIVLGTTRLGFTELTIIDALSDYLHKTKELRKDIEAVYNGHPDIGLISKKIKSHGMKGIKNIKMEVGVPILAQKCQRLSNPHEIIEKMGGTAWAEYKFDGTRVQLHMDRKKKIMSSNLEQSELFKRGGSKIFIKTYTRNLEETTHQFPDIIGAADKQINATSVILDGEAIGYDKDSGEFLTFQEIIKRKRKHGVKETVKQIPLKYFVFDILYLNGKPLINEPLTKRRKKLDTIIKKGTVIQVDTHLETTEPDQLAQFFEESKEKNLEGLVVKNPDSLYQAGARSYAWVKLKKAATELLEDDFDCVILGYYHGKGARSSLGIGRFLVGVYDSKEDVFKSITKVGTGLKENQWVKLRKKADKIKLKKQPANVKVNKNLYPDVWTQPKIMAVIKAEEISKSPIHTAGFALRFPRFVGFRTDKKPEDATSITEIANLHKQQKRGYY